MFVNEGYLEIKMKSYYCKRLYEEINFDADNVYVCCGNSLGPSLCTPNLSDDKNYYKIVFTFKFTVVNECN